MSSFSQWILIGLGLYVAINYKLYLQAFRSLRDRWALMEIGAKPKVPYVARTAKEVVTVALLSLGWSKDKISKFLSSYSTELNDLDSAPSKQYLIKELEVLISAFEIREEGAK